MHYIQTWNSFVDVKMQCTSSLSKHYSHVKMPYLLYVFVHLSIVQCYTVCYTCSKNMKCHQTIQIYFFPYISYSVRANCLRHSETGFSQLLISPFCKIKWYGSVIAIQLQALGNTGLTLLILRVACWIDGGCLGSLDYRVFMMLNNQLQLYAVPHSTVGGAQGKGLPTLTRMERL